MKLSIETGKANFLDIKQKCGDWRYITYKKIRSYDPSWHLDEKPEVPERKVIHWIGVIKLSDVNESIHFVPIYFVNGAGKLVKDYEYRREPDGAQAGGTNTVFYDIEEIHHVLLKKKRLRKKKYFNVWLEEWVNYTGLHNVHLLYDDKVPIVYGIATEKPWPQEPAIDYIGYHSLEITEETKRVFLLANKPYQWMK